MSGPRTHNAPSISRAAAVALIAAVRNEATVAGFGVATAVTDAGGHLVAFERTDGTPFLAAEVAIDKAWTAASFRLATHTWNSPVADPHVAPLAHHPRLMAVGGGSRCSTTACAWVGSESPVEPPDRTRKRLTRP